MARDIVIVGAARTAVGAFNGGFANTPAHDLGAIAIKAALERAKVDAAEVDEVILGQVLTAAQGQNPARQAAIHAGIPNDKTAWGLNQVCGSGLRTVAIAMQQIANGDAGVPQGRRGDRCRRVHPGRHHAGGRRQAEARLLEGRHRDGRQRVGDQRRRCRPRGDDRRGGGAARPDPARADRLLRDLIEANEAFAAQAIAVNKDMGWDTDRVNFNGGAIAIGHPIGASGARVLVTLLHEMQRRDAKKGLATLCIGGGMGVAMCVER